MVRAAETIAGRYKLLDVLGRGGMSVVYRAHDRVLARTVAVKVLPAAYAEDLTLVQRFAREARAVASLNHPNIVAVYDSGRDGTVHYIVMECVPGVSLAQLLRERGPLAVDEAVEIASQVASALAAAHAAGIVHRDVKPANVMVLPPGSIKVLDFGIARARDDGALTRTTTVLGSAPYMAPEVAMGGAADERSDIYSLGCLVYEMLSGSPPFMADLPLAVMHQHANAAPQPVRERRPEVPAALDALVMQMLAKAPDERPQHADRVVAALGNSLRETAAPHAPAPAPANRPPPIAHRPTDVQEPTRVLAPTRPPRRAWMVAAAVLGALLVGLAVALAASSGPRPERTTGSSQPRRTSQSTSASSTASHTSSASSSVGRTSATSATSTRSSTTPRSTTSSTTSTSSTPPTSTSGSASATSTTP